MSSVPYSIRRSKLRCSACNGRSFPGDHLANGDTASVVIGAWIGRSESKSRCPLWAEFAGSRAAKDDWMNCRAALGQLQWSRFRRRPVRRRYAWRTLHSANPAEETCDRSEWQSASSGICFKQVRTVTFPVEHDGEPVSLAPQPPVAAPAPGSWPCSASSHGITSPLSVASSPGSTSLFTYRNGWPSMALTQ